MAERDVRTGAKFGIGAINTKNTWRKRIMRRVITKPEPKNVVLANETKEFKMYVLRTPFSIYMLRTIGIFPDIRWQWLSILQPRNSFMATYSKFYDALLEGLNTGSEIHELDNVGELIEYLREYEEEYLEVS